MGIKERFVAFCVRQVPQCETDDEDYEDETDDEDYEDETDDGSPLVQEVGTALLQLVALWGIGTALLCLALIYL